MKKPGPIFITGILILGILLGLIWAQHIAKADIFCPRLGILESPGGQLRIDIKIAKDNGGSFKKLDNLERGGSDIPVAITVFSMEL